MNSIAAATAAYTETGDIAEMIRLAQDRETLSTVIEDVLSAVRMAIELNPNSIHLLYRTANLVIDHHELLQQANASTVTLT